MKNIINNLKDPKKRSLTLLGVYLVFFIFVFLVIDSGKTYTLKEKNINFDKEETITEEKIDNYNYTFMLNNNIVTGTFFNNTSLFTFESNNYYLENNITYVINNDHYYESSIIYNVDKLLNIGELMKNREEYSTTSYKDGRSVVTYLVPLNDFYNFYYGFSIEDDRNIEIAVEKNNNIISKISIDLTGIDDNLNLITLQYSDVNNISSLNFNKDNYIYGE